MVHPSVRPSILHLSTHSPHTHKAPTHPLTHLLVHPPTTHLLTRCGPLAHPPPRAPICAPPSLAFSAAHTPASTRCCPVLTFRQPGGRDGDLIVEFLRLLSCSVHGGERLGFLLCGEPSARCRQRRAPVRSCACPCARPDVSALRARVLGNKVEISELCERRSLV